MKTIYNLVELTDNIIESLENDKEYYFVKWNGIARSGTKTVLSQNEGIKSVFLAEEILDDEERINGREAELCSKIHDQRKEIESLKQKQQDWIIAFGNFCEVINNQNLKQNP